MKKVRIILLFYTMLILLYGCKTKVKNDFTKENNQTQHYVNSKPKAGTIYGENINDVDTVELDDNGNIILKTKNGEIYTSDINGNEKPPSNTKSETEKINAPETSGNGRKLLETNIDIQGLDKNMYAWDYYISIDNYTYDITTHYDEYRINFDFKCTVLKEYELLPNQIQLAYKVIDSEGYTIRDGNLCCGGKKYKGEKFKFQDSISLKKGNYKIIFFDNTYEFGSYY